MNCVPLIRRLIEEGEDPSQDSWFWGCPIYIAAYQGNHELLELFLYDTSPGNYIVKKARAVQGANRASRLSMLNLVLQPRWGHILPTQGYLIRALKSCQWNKDAKIVRRMVEELAAHTPFHNPGGLPLNNLGALIINAARYGYLEKVQNLLVINAPVDELHDEHENMPLLSACLEGRYEIVKLLLESGANPNPANVWETPLQAAVKRGYVRISKLLLDHGA